MFIVTNFYDCGLYSAIAFGESFPVFSRLDEQNLVFILIANNFCRTNELLKLSGDLSGVSGDMECPGLDHDDLLGVTDEPVHVGVGLDKGKSGQSRAAKKSRN